MRMTAERDGRTSQSLERGLAILSSFSSGRQLVGTSEIARELGLTRSTTHRYIATLSRLGYLQQDPTTRRYGLGPRVLDLGFTAINSMELRHVAAPHLRRLCDETGHTVNMAILDDADIVYVERCRASRGRQSEIDLDLHVGSRLPAYCTSLGKVLLAYLPPDRRDELLDAVALARRGPNTITDRPALVAELERRGHEALAVRLPAEDDAAGWNEYADAVATALGDRQPVVLVAQSLAGFTAPLVAARRPVALIVLLNAMVPRPGETGMAWWSDTRRKEAEQAYFASVGLPLETADDDLAVYFHDVAPELVAEAAAHEPEQSMTPMEQPWPLDA